jgi:hypothetical protein
MSGTKVVFLFQFGRLEGVHLVIDFQASYGTLWRKEIWSEMH